MKIKLHIVLCSQIRKGDWTDLATLTIKIPDDRVKSYEDISNQNIEASMKELRNIPYTIRYTSVVMPELLRIIRQYDFTKDW